MMSLDRIVTAVRRRPLKHFVRLAQTWAFGDNLYAAAALRIISEHDARRPTAPTNTDPFLTTLHDRGFVNLGNVGIDVSPFGEKAARVFDAQPQSDPHLNKISIRYPACFDETAIAFLRSESINAIVRAYLGDDATVDEVQLFRTPNCSADNGISGQWHHDGVGHVLLLWVLLHDLDDDSRATWYAVGSHQRTISSVKMSESRSTDEDIERTGCPKARLTGRKGDAILMDPHGFHRATFNAGAKQRDVLYVGYSSYAKAIALKNPIMNHGVGIVDDRFPADFDPSGTLVRRERLVRKGTYTQYAGFGARPVLESSRCMSVVDV
jgi:hypothetical protein